MPQVVGVGLRYLKTLWFDPGELEPVEGDVVIVKTERGEEMGVVREERIELNDDQIDNELTEIVRIATQDDLEYALELGEKEKEAMGPFRELITKNELDMKPIDVEYLFGGDKIVFYFTSEQRVDFRQLVKDLANHFHSRIDMRQMGSRDQARMIGGLGRCGDELCCARFSGDFEPVSIRMAKAQGLPPNPTKISGACGRLMCCLRYEVSAYEDFNKRAPKKGAKIETPKGDAEVVEVDALREMVKLRFPTEDDSKPEVLDVPLDLMRCKLGKNCKGHGAEGTCCDNATAGAEISRPCQITKETFSEFEKAEHADDFLEPLPIVFKDSKTQSGKSKSKSKGKGKGKSRGAKSEQQSDAASSPSRRERRRGGRRRGAQKQKGSGEPAQTGKQRSQNKQQTPQNQQQGRKRRRSKDKNTSARQKAVATKGSKGTEANVREAKRVPRRRRNT
ncbi:MAG: hypothetical protein FWE87_05275 [Coriobacteriia bacterium]|nr:hypothetical protein [Coriobacteriia bacterium]